MLALERSSPVATIAIRRQKVSESLQRDQYRLAVPQVLVIGTTSSLETEDDGNSSIKEFLPNSAPMNPPHNIILACRSDGSFL